MDRTLDYESSDEGSTPSRSTKFRTLQFHHVDRTLKEFGIAAEGATRAWSEVVEELKKCILLCANCHAEQEDFYCVLV